MRGSPLFTKLLAGLPPHPCSLFPTAVGREGDFVCGVNHDPNQCGELSRCFQVGGRGKTAHTFKSLLSRGEGQDEGRISTTRVSCFLEGPIPSPLSPLPRGEENFVYGVTHTPNWYAELSSYFQMSKREATALTFKSLLPWGEGQDKGCTSATHVPCFLAGRNPLTSVSSPQRRGGLCLQG